jgi:hypothetical protein
MQVESECFWTIFLHWLGGRRGVTWCIAYQFEGCTNYINFCLASRSATWEEHSYIVLFCYHHRRCGANVQHRRYMYYAAGIKSVSLPNCLVTRHRLNDHQKRIVVQGDSEHDLCTNSSNVEAMLMFTSTDVSAVEVTAELHRRQSGRSTRQQCHDHYIGGWCAHTMVMIAFTQADRLPMHRC